jgi:hypothetical protein
MKKREAKDVKEKGEEWICERKIRSEKEREDEGWPFRSFQTTRKKFQPKQPTFVFFFSLVHEMHMMREWEACTTH